MKLMIMVNDVVNGYRLDWVDMDGESKSLHENIETREELVDVLLRKIKLLKGEIYG